MEFGAILKACREKASMSQEKLAELMNMTRSCVSKIEHNQKTVPARVLIDWVTITNAREVMVAYMFGMDGVMIMQQILQMMVTIPLMMAA